MAKNDYVEWVQRGLAKNGKTKTGLAKALGLTHPQGSRIADGTRPLKAWELPAVAAYLDEPIPEEGRLHLNGPRTKKQSGPRIPVKGAVRAGMWLAVDEGWDAGEHYLRMRPLPEYPPDDQYALQVMGDSMNLTLREGEYAVCVNVDALGRMPRHNELVVVERVSNGLHEVTIKRVCQVSDTRIELRPESDNSVHKPFILDDADPREENTDIRIKAVVIAAYRDL